MSVYSFTVAGELPHGHLGKAVRFPAEWQGHSAVVRGTVSSAAKAPVQQGSEGANLVKIVLRNPQVATGVDGMLKLASLPAREFVPVSDTSSGQESIAFRVKPEVVVNIENPR